ncbi:hypothetical protein PENANT_c015G08449 [Penicillium antarcticum]|uniref:Ketoreductase (KR) domain-containing protein n=1 Tax=Penicillium antarcticum TaxID=416450 RepID=A0A1V6Q485_9EURO|nr:uncharacterized protein N7508_004772 [Penicillium antarcticum]KAJ5305757.1 hypothetical protein N7508_004772 [Penicillium antarcticum]OQD83682.1 hypothetical protein PENANT_c015G08449 [Penicillium antarcticum]
MVSIEEVRKNNSTLKEYGPNLVAVFVGGTSGIGETTARAFVRSTLSPRVYLVGRSESRASQIIEELRASNPDGQINFVKSDVSRLHDVDEACKAIQAKEEKVNLLFLSAGILTTKGRDETDEGLDKKLSLHYYSRMRFLNNLLPQLTKAATSIEGPAGIRGNLSSVVSVLDARGNAPLILKDLSLKDNYTLRNAANHAITMTSLSMEELAAAHPSTSFIHAFPGLVKTGLARDYNFVMKAAVNAMLTLASRWTVPLEESGERHLYTATSPIFSPKETARGVAALGSDGVQGSGAYLIGSDSATVPDQKVLHGYREDGTRGKVWQHTLDTFKGIVGN